MRILIVTHYYPEHRGGIELVAGQLASAMMRRGVEVTWAASGPAPRAAPHGIAYLPMQACNVVERVTGFAYPLWGLLDLVRLIAAVGRCDLVHLHECLYLGQIAAFLTANVLNKDVVITQHMGQIPFLRDLRWFQRLLRTALTIANWTVARVILGGCRRCIFISEEARNYYASFVRFEDEAATIYNGIDLSVFHPVSDAKRRRLRVRHAWPEGTFVALFVGRFVARKGIEVMRWLAARMPDVEWVFIGWGREDPSRWGLDNVRCLGLIDHPVLADYYRAADLLMLPSVIEGFPLVVQEAMACGTPALITDVVARAVPGVGEAAFLVDPNPPRILAVLREIVSSPDALKGRRETAAAFARTHWDSEVNLRRHVDRLLSRRDS